MKHIQNNRELFESVFHYSTDGIVVFDLQAKILNVNPAFERMTGWSKMELLNEEHPLTPADELEYVMKCFRAVASGNLPFVEYQGKKIRKNGSYVDIIATLSPIKDERGNVIAVTGMAKDITELMKTQEFILQSEKLSAIGQLAAGIAHEIRNPLTSLKGFLKLLSPLSNDLGTKYISIMEGELDRIEQIVNEFLVLAKPQPSEFKLGNSVELLHHVITLMESQANMNNIEINTIFDMNAPLVLCNKNQLKQVFLNVIKNAIEAMPKGGTLHIQTKTNNQTIQIIVTDEGKGIPHDELKKIGDPFFTTKDGGTGLGLLVSQRIIKNHRGAIDISSKVGNGTTVTITLPSISDTAEGRYVSVSP
jgi:two-component system, sporulation sensor kinase A